MKKVISWILFIVMILVFVHGIYYTVLGAINIKKQLDILDATGVSGVDYWGVGVDIFIIGVALISVVGIILSIASLTISQSRLMKIISIILLLLFILMIFSCPFFAYL